MNEKVVDGSAISFFTLCKAFVSFALHSDFCKAHFLAILVTNCRGAFKNRNLAIFLNTLMFNLLKI